MKCGLHFILTLDAYEFGRSLPEAGLSRQPKNQGEWERGRVEVMDNLGAGFLDKPQQQDFGRFSEPEAHYASWDDRPALRVLKRVPGEFLSAALEGYSRTAKH